MRFLDTHTEGEPTRVLLEDALDLGDGPLSERVARFRDRHDACRTAAVCEPRGSDAVVGALLCRPHAPDCAAGAIFFNNVGCLGMCGHGAMGVAAALRRLGRIGPGRHRLDTPVGPVALSLSEDNAVTIENVPSYRYRKAAAVTVDGLGEVVGDVAWGGNWFFLANDAPHTLDRRHIRPLTEAALRIRERLRADGVTGADGADIDHIEFFGPPQSPEAHSRNFVLCPGGAYDRSPCGTGTSAKLACLASDAALAPDAPWIQESVIGSRFEAAYQLEADGRILPRITGRAYVCAEGALVLDPADPFVHGIA